MRTMFQLGRVGFDKQGLSNMIAYVMLISISLALSVIVFNWLRPYAENAFGGDGEECSDGVNIIISDYVCVHDSGGGNASISLTLKNRGRFTVDGYVLGVNDRPGADIGVFILDDVGVSVPAAGSIKVQYNVSNEHIDGGNYGFTDPLEALTYLEIQPFVIDDTGDELVCPRVSSQVVSSCI